MAGSRSNIPAANATDSGSMPARMERWSLNRLFALRRSDRPVLMLVTPLFTVVTAASVIVATSTRAVFLTEYSVAMLPLMFLGSALFTALASLGYVAIIERVALVPRFVGLLALAVLSFAALQAAYPLSPHWVALIQLVWCTGIAHLLLIQSWNMMSALVPARQGKRLFPVLAAVSTLGAALGGGLVHALLPVSGARNLMVPALLMLVFPLIRVEKIVKALSRAAADNSSPIEVPEVSGRPVRSSPPAGGAWFPEVTRGVASIWRSPLLGRLAGLVFLLQAASLIIDFQFSTELKLRYDRDELAGFLGIYYGLSNLVAFFVALLATGRIVRVVGIGMAISASAVLLALGSSAYFLTAVMGLGFGFWAIAATSFAERVTQFALTKNAMQLLVMPLEMRKGERAKTLIDGVVYRIATALVSGVLLLLAPSAQHLGLLAPAAILACLGVIGLGWSIGPHYRRALLAGLRARRVDADVDPQTRALLERSALIEVRQRCARGGVAETLQALKIARDSRLPLTIADLDPAARHTDPEVARLGLELLNDLGLTPSRDLLESLLATDPAPPVLREVLRLLLRVKDPSLAPKITPLVQNSDAGVARLALMWMKAAGVDEPRSVGADLAADLRSDSIPRRARAAYISSVFSVDGGPDLVHMLEDPSSQVRLNAVLSMGQVGSSEFVGPLVRSLGRGELVQAASDALFRYGHAVLNLLDEQLADPTLPPALRLRVMRVIERFGNAKAVDLLMRQADAHSDFVRDHALLVLWRIAREPDRPHPPLDWLRMRMSHEIELLLAYDQIEALAAATTVPHLHFLSELHASRLRADLRGFRLLGLVGSRAAMHRAWLHYRSKDVRARSTAIELLDQHVSDPVLRPFVALVEAGDRASGQQDSAFTPLPGIHSTPQQMPPILATVEPWLERVWEWAQRPQEAKVGRDAMDLVFLLKGVSLFSDLSGEQLLPLTEIVQHAHVEAGDLVFAEGQPAHHLYVLLEGEVEVLHGGEVVATLGSKECFGEMALLDQSLRSASIRVRKDADLLAIARDDFQDLLDLHPTLARGVIRVLTKRLRMANETVSAELHR
jgi:HEAT repeat protein